MAVIGFTRFHLGFARAGAEFAAGRIGEGDISNTSY